MLCFCPKNPDENIDAYKDFVQHIRRKEFEEPYIIVTDDTSEKLKEYVQLLIDVQLKDGNYHAYFGQVKKIIKSFLIYYNCVIDDVIKENDAFAHETLDKGDLIDLIENTVHAHQDKQVKFGKSFLPVKTPWEKRIYEEIEEEYEEFMKKLADLKLNIRKIDRLSQVEDFAKKYFPLGVRRMAEIFDTTHLYIGMMLADRVPEISTSLEEIVMRVRNNLSSQRADREQAISDLMNHLYDGHKEFVASTRCYIRDSEGMAEALRKIDNIKSKIENFGINPSIKRLETELEYWSTKLNYLYEIINNLTALRDMQQETNSKEQKYHYLWCNHLLGCKRKCRRMFRVEYSQSMDEIKDRLINETRALFTFFAVRGTDRILYTDNIGPFYVDEFNHQNYVFNYGMDIYHKDCDGNFTDVLEHPYYFDKYGRYIEKDGEKIYQNARCTSMYKLNEYDYLEKVTKDCGHSEKINKNCNMDITDPNDVEILPNSKPIDIRKTLPTETVRYLWDCFGCVLPEALHDVGQEKPKNPIHFLAHKILYHKYRRTKSELQQQKDEAEQYRANIFNERKGKKKVEAASKLKSHQAKRRKPEESDDTETRAAYDAMVAQEVFIMAINQDYGN